jgi:hypothetical protein
MTAAAAAAAAGSAAATVAARASAEAETVERPPRPETPEPEAVPRPEPSMAESPARPQTPAKPKPREPEPPKAKAPAPKPPAPEPPAPEPRESEPRAPRRIPRSDLLERLAAEPMLSRRFRLFRSELEAARGMSASGLRELLDRFPAGWGQRRVLDALFQEGIPASVNQAIFLLEHLDSAPARRWCVKTLLNSWDLNDAERSALIERHDIFRVAAATR